MMQILLTGGTGFIGSELIKRLATAKIVLLTRDIEAARQRLYHTDLGNIAYINSLDGYSDLNQFDAVINLAGEPIAHKRWRDKQKKIICDSRWQITERLVQLIKDSSQPPSLFISGSAIGYYGDQQDQAFDESRPPQTDSFTYQVCSRWESIALHAQSQQTRVCILRTGIVLGLEGGALKAMLPAFRLGIGTIQGSGKQFMPWIHIRDMVRCIVFLLDTPQAHGLFNCSAPHPVKNSDFNRTLAHTLKRPLFLSLPKGFFDLLMGEASCLLFDSLRAKPKHLTSMGFNFRYSRLEPALKNLLQRPN